MSLSVVTNKNFQFNIISRLQINIEFVRNVDKTEIEQKMLLKTNMTLATTTKN